MINFYVSLASRLVLASADNKKSDQVKEEEKEPVEKKTDGERMAETFSKIKEKGLTSQDLVNASLFPLPAEPKIKNDIDTHYLAILQRILWQQETEKVKKYLQKAIEKFPSSVKAHYLMGFFYMAQNDPKAITHFKKTIELGGIGYENAALLLAGVYFNAENYKEALKVYAQLFKVQPEKTTNDIRQKAFIHKRAGLCAYNLNKYSLAISHLKKSLEIDPEQEEAYTVFSLICLMESALKRQEEIQKPKIINSPSS